MKLTNLESKIIRKAGKLIHDFELISEGDNIMVAVSGGKDSLALLHILEILRRKAPVRFTITAVHLYQGQPGFELEGVKENIKKIGFEPLIIDKPTYPIVKNMVREGQTSCFICSRMRRGIIYNFAHENGFNKIALGHHREDMLETFLMNLFRTGQIKTLPPYLRSDDGRNVVIRPLLLTAEAELAALCAELGLLPVPCGTCSKQPDLERKKMKELLMSLEVENPYIRDVMTGALKHIKPRYLLDRRLIFALSLNLDESGEEDF